jgi:hypothetical protein
MAPQGRPGLLVPPGLLARLDLLVPQVLQDLLARLDLLVPQVLQDLLARLDLLVPQAPWDLPARLDLLAPQVPQDLPAPSDLPGPREPRGQAGCESLMRSAKKSVCSRRQPASFARSTASWCRFG